ncbi:MAG: hypothetical protein ACRD2L_13130, partial [Terriglobia bacterium]
MQSQKPKRYLACLLLIASFTLSTASAGSQERKPTTSETKPCNCANASLINDTVGTQFGGGAVVPRVVNSLVELPNAGPTLGAAGLAPRWNINYGSNTIRIDFLQQVATYGAGVAFVFSSLDPQLAGCPPAFISGIAVTTNKPTVPFNVVTAATFGPHKVTVQIAPNAGNLDWQPGEFILVTLSFACETSTPEPNPIDPCCPPWNKDLLKDMLFYQGQGSISAPYTLKFQPTTVFKNQMQAYINYLHALNPAMSAITIDWRLSDQGANATPNPPYGPQIGSTVWTTWNWNTTGIGAPVFTNPGFFSGFPMQVGTWYMVHTGIYLENGQKFFPDKCAVNEILVRLQVMGAKTRG